MFTELKKCCGTYPIIEVYRVGMKSYATCVCKKCGNKTKVHNTEYRARLEWNEKDFK